MRYTVLILILLLLNIHSYAQTYEKYLQEAEKNYKAKNKEKAKELYLKAAKEGSAKAHFYLAYRLGINTTYNYIQGAKKGDADSLEYALNNLVFYADEIKKSNIKEALDLYYEVKTANPKLKIYDEKTKIDTLKMANEAEESDINKFLKKYKIDLKNKNNAYFFWQLAEEVSKGKFGKANPFLIFNLVVKGSAAPAEYESAVESTYNNWKKGITKFNICEHITSGFGMSFCTFREYKKDEQRREKTLSILKQNLSNKTISLLDNAYLSASKFIKIKTELEEGHGGSGRGAWILNSKSKQKDNYIKSIKKVIHGFTPDSKYSLKQYDKKLNLIYKKVMQKLKKEKRKYPEINYKDIITVQRSWIKYRDDSAKLFESISPSIKKEKWLAYLTKIRNKQLKILFTRIKND